MGDKAIPRFHTDGAHARSAASRSATSQQLFQRWLRHAHACSGNSDARIPSIQHPEARKWRAALVNPLPRTERVLKQGRQTYANYCSVCHGILGNGAPTLTAAYGAKPANLVSRSVIELPDGKIHHVIMAGKNAMPAYAADLSEDERWAAVHYVRVLQRALNAKDEDIKMIDDLRLTIYELKHTSAAGVQPLSKGVCFNSSIRHS